MLWWSDELATGIQIIDDQHKTLFEKINNCLTSAKEENSEQLTETLEYLCDYVIFHFGEEERWMFRTGYENFDEHRDKHSYFIKEVFELKRQFQKNGMRKEIGSALRLLMVEWLIGHIDNDDKKFANALK